MGLRRLPQRLLTRVRTAPARRRTARTPPRRVAELYDEFGAWPPAAAPFPAPLVDDPGGTDREVLDLDPRWAGRPIVLPPVHVHEIAGAAIRAGGVVEYPDGRLILESVKRPGHLLQSPELRRRPSVSTRSGVGTTISLSSRNGNYFHWLVDMVPRLYALERLSGPVELVVADDVPPFVDALLERVVRDPISVVKCPADHAYRYDTVRLSTFTTVWSHGLLRPEIAEWLRGRLREGIPAGDRRRIYVHRVGTRARCIANDDEILSLVRSFGIEPVRPELLPFDEQLALFAAADVIVGPCGAGLTNMVAAETATVVDINPGGRRGQPYHPGFWSLARSCGHRYVTVPHDAGLHQASYVVDADRVRAALELAGEPAGDWRTAIV